MIGCFSDFQINKKGGETGRTDLLFNDSNVVFPGSGQKASSRECREKGILTR